MKYGDYQRVTSRLTECKPAPVALTANPRRPDATPERRTMMGHSHVDNEWAQPRVVTLHHIELCGLYGTTLHWTALPGVKSDEAMDSPMT